MTPERLPPVIAIDGPTASGKGTVAAGVAAALGFHYLDSGALYRVVGLAALRAGARLDDGAALAALAQRIAPAFVEGKIVQDGEDITLPIRAEDVGRAASQCAVHPAVRQALLERQRAFRQPPGLVADGRDMGTVIFADAPYKVFLTASAGERAERRYKQLKQKGMDVTLAALLREILARDARDAQRPVAPLKPAPDAVLIDTSGTPIETVVARVLALVRSHPEPARA